MASKDSKKAKPAQKKTGKKQKPGDQRLSDDDLKRVSGGLRSQSGLSDNDPCISSFG